MTVGFQANCFQHDAFQMEVGGDFDVGNSHPAKGGKATRIKKVLARNEALDEARRRGTLRKVGMEEGGGRQGFADLEDFFKAEERATKPKTAKQKAAAAEKLALILAETPRLDDVLKQLQVVDASAAHLVENIIQNDVKLRELLRLRAEAEDEEDIIELLLLEH